MTVGGSMWRAGSGVQSGNRHTFRHRDMATGVLGRFVFEKLVCLEAANPETLEKNPGNLFGREGHFLATCFLCH